jgi:hypothetical protein
MAEDLMGGDVEVRLRARSAADIERIWDAIEDGEEVDGDLLASFSESQSSLVEDTAYEDGDDAIDFELAWDFITVKARGGPPADVLVIEAAFNLVVSAEDADYFWDLVDSEAYQRASAALFVRDVKRHLETRGLADLVVEYSSAREAGRSGA